MKKIFLCLLAIISLVSCAKPVKQPFETTQKEITNEYRVKSVWITYYELEKLIENKNETQFKKKVSEEFKKLKNMGFNTVTVQVRPYADAFYISNYFPSSKYCFGEQGSDMLYDPFEIICDKADNIGLKVEAWINPYRVHKNKKISELSDNNIAKKWYKNKKTKSNVYIDKTGIYFNPASESVTNLIVNGVKEVVKNYNISAVHFDDYFYPTTDKSIDKKEYKKYRTEGAKLSLSDFRRKCVSDMVKRVYKAIKKINSNVKFGISPSADIENNYNTFYADVEKWISEEGYIDYVCPQVYFGFKNVYKPFMFTVKKWMYITNCDMYVGLPLYKANKADKYAASENESIINEFKNNDNIIARQIKYLSKLNEIKGIYVFSYSSLYDDNFKKEVENMLKELKEY